MSNTDLKNMSISDSWHFQDEVKYTNTILKWINEEVVRQISLSNNEPEWMLELRLKALKIFLEKD